MIKLYKLPLLFCLVFAALSGKAQTNIGLLATASASTCNTGACATLNDNILGTCGTQLIWISTSTPPSTTPGVEWIQFTWTSVRSMNQFVIHHAETGSRFMSGATIQRWTGTAWATVSSFGPLTPACSSVVNFPLTSTDRIRLTAFTASGTQLSNLNFREIQVFGPTVNNDASVTALSALNTCTYSQSIAATVTNFGRRRLDSFRLNWSVNNVLQGTQYINSSLTTTQSATYTLSSSYTFAPSTQYVIRAWTTLPNGTTDSVPGNDALIQTLNFMGSPADPAVSNITQCGRGFPRLTATTTDAADSIFWYDAASGGNMLGFGKSITGPFTVSTRTFHAQAAKLSSNFRITTTGNTGVNVTQTNNYGGMQNIVINKPILMDSIQFRLWYATPTNVGYQLYYRPGTYVGFQTSSTGWIKINEGVANFVVQGGQNFGRVSAQSLNLPAGTYSFYITTDLNFGAGNSLWSQSAGGAVSNADIAIQTPGSIVTGLFGSTQVIANWQPQIQYIYKTQCASVNRTPLTVTVKPRPIGANVVAGAPFQGQFRLGLPSDPDVIEVGKTVTYEMTPPSGFNNGDHGSTWMLTGASARTRFNVPVPSGDYTVNSPSGSANASLTFKPSSTWLDSTITFSVRFIDMGPHFCDSTVTRTVYVAPTPRPNFFVPATICLGEQTLFENLTTIHSGVATYMWYFDDGDSSDLNSPVHEYKNPGTYNVRLIARSFRWNVVKDTTIQVNISEIPTVDFKVRNACQGSAVTFSNLTFIGNGTLTYSWNFGDGSANVTSVNASRIYGQPGPYNVTLTAEANGCKAVKSKVAYQFAKPVASFIKLSGNCLNDQFSFGNNSSISLGQFGNKWEFRDGGNIASDKNPVYTFQSPGTKNVKLTVISEFGCSASDSLPILVKQIPTTNFSYPFACDRTATQFTNTTNLNGETLNQYNWTFGGGMTSSATSPIVSWPNVGSRTVTLKTTLANGCSSEISKPVSVGVQPKADFEFEEKCSGEPVTFTNLSTFSNGSISYEWNFGNNVKSTTASPIYLFNSGSSTQTFNVQLKASIQGGCADSIIKAVTIQALPSTCDFNYALNFSVNPRNYILTPVGGSLAGNSYTWIMGDGNRISSNGAGTNYTFSGNLKYCVTMIATNAGGCECSTTKCFPVSLGLDKAAMDASISIYPNPNNGLFTVNAEDATAQMQINIYNSNGQLVFSNLFDSNNTQIDLSNFATGLYSVNVVTDHANSTKTITINR